MRIARYQHDGRVAVGAVEGDAAAAVVRPFPEGVTVLELLSQSPEGRAGHALGAPVPLADVRLLVPLQPPSVRDFVSFEQHVEGMVMGEGVPFPEAWYAAPAFYFSNPSSLYATGEEVPMPPRAQRYDYELEVAAIIGRHVRNLTLESARQAIAGYAVFNDWSARDLQVEDRRLGMGWAKGKDTASTLGPWIVTADELETHRDAEGRLDLRMTVWRNGVEMGTDTLASAAWTFEQMLVYASRGTALAAGDLIGSGTCGGGCLAELWGRDDPRHPEPLQPGDVIRMTVEHLGTIENTVVAGPEPVDHGTARRRT
ncbi:MAG TPA: fumarylacetoacetate hydrolase family protein [Solirubrobacteraceae bacterium]|nr:fumarylacetoacetate hydrolase family protein [Solirubrobacteraceae bacterium]